MMNLGVLETSNCYWLNALQDALSALRIHLINVKIVMHGNWLLKTLSMLVKTIGKVGKLKVPLLNSLFVLELKCSVVSMFSVRELLSPKPMKIYLSIIESSLELNSGKLILGMVNKPH